MTIGTAHPAWRPLLEGELFRRATDAIDTVITQLRTRQDPGGKEPQFRLGSRAGLAGGLAGHAILYMYRSYAYGRTDDRATAIDVLNDAIATVSATPLDFSLFNGFPGISWATEHATALLSGSTEDLNSDIDAAVLDGLAHVDRGHTFDLVSGLVGLGVYALERLPHDSAARCIEGIVLKLADRASHDSAGTSWHTAYELLAADQREAYPAGRYDLGVAHGIGGVIAFLGRVCAARIALPTARALLDGAVAWLLAHELPARSGGCFPSVIAPNECPQPARLAWCYGDVGLSAALLLAARCVANVTWEREALRIARAAARRPPESSRVVDASFCHGSAGIAHIFNRLFQATGDIQCRDAAYFWLDQTLAYWEVAKPHSGFTTAVPDAAGALRRYRNLSVLVGSAGVALVLLAATTTIEPQWDRVFLLSHSIHDAEAES